MGFSDFGLNLYREFAKIESGKSFVSSPIYLQRYTVFRLWRVTNVQKDDLSLLYFCQQAS